ncbi:hypothetical protein [Clostridium lundense]|uniref:hypothetical protein n=1 Tax=Clostridium lundense TaxID=319475 RepID=UPI000485B469|nr:hypothetical protein [Clostridium lundense]
MSLNKKHAAIGIVLLIITWVGNVFYYKKHVLKEPIFLKHYYHITKENSDFKLYYIENINSKENINNIVFPEVGEEHIEFYKYSDNTNKRYYQMKSVGINIYKDDSAKILEKYENKVITNVKVEFSSGRVMNVDIGKIYLCSDNEGKDVLFTRKSSYSDSSSGYDSFIIDKNIKIKAICSKFPEITNDILQVNKESLKNIKFPITLKTGDKLDIKYKFKFNKDDIRKNYLYRFPLNIIIGDSKESKVFYSRYVNYCPQFLDEIDVNSLINDKERK